MEIIKNFFGFGAKDNPYGGTPDGYLSWQHLTFVSTFVLSAIILAIILGVYYKNKDEKAKNKVLIWAAIIIDLFEITKIIIGCIDHITYWKTALPLFLAFSSLFL